MNRELREDAFRQGNLALEQASVWVHVVKLAELPRTPDGFALTTDLMSIVLANHQAHENGLSTDSRQVSTWKLVPSDGLVFSSHTVFAPPQNLPLRAPPEAGYLPGPDDVAPAPAEGPAQPGERDGGRPLAQFGATSSSSTLDAPPTQQPLEFKDSFLYEQMKRDKDTDLVRKVLLARKKGHINTHEDLDRHLKHARDPIRVRRMIALTDSRTPPESTRHGEVRWDDVEGIKGFLPFSTPEIVVGRVIGAFGLSGSPAPSTVKLDLLWALHPERSKDPSFFGPKRKGPLTLEVHVESAEVGLRLLQFWGRCKVRLKLTVSRGVELHGRFRRTVAEVYPEGLDESERRAQAEWVALELARVPPETEEWFAPEPTQTCVGSNSDDT